MLTAMIMGVMPLHYEIVVGIGKPGMSIEDSPRQSIETHDLYGAFLSIVEASMKEHQATHQEAQSATDWQSCRQQDLIAEDDTAPVTNTPSVPSDNGVSTIIANRRKRIAQELCKSGGMTP